MEKLKFNIDINAPKQKVWDVLWNDATYPQWTSVFSEGSRAESDWKEGSRILFLNADGDGMFSEIETLIENRQMVFKHLGEIIKGVEKPADKSWEGAREKYFLEGDDDATKLAVELDGADEHKDYFSKIFPEALEIVKQLSEKS